MCLLINASQAAVTEVSPKEGTRLGGEREDREGGASVTQLLLILVKKKLAVFMCLVRMMR